MRWEIWAVVAANLGRLHEVKHQWNLDELMDAHEYLAIKADAEAFASQQASAAGR